MVTKRLLPLWLFLISAPALFAQTGFKPAWAKPKPSIADQLQDGWIITEIGGEAMDRNAAPISVLFLESEYFIKRDTDTLEAGTYTLTPQGDGTWIDFRIREGENAGKTQLGLVKIEGRELYWCMGEAGSGYRPTYFANVAAGQGAAAQTIVAALRANPARQATPTAEATPTMVQPPAPPPKAPATLQEQLQGTWMAQTINGSPPSRSQADTGIRFWGNRYIWTTGGTTHTGQFRLNDATNPAQIDFYSDDGKLTEQGILKVEDASLHLHFVLGSNQRPADFQDPFCAQYVLRRGAQAPAANASSTKTETPMGNPEIPKISARPASRSTAASTSTLKLEGEWLVMRWNGQTPNQPMMMRFTGDLWHFFVNGEEKMKTPWRIDAASDPIAFEFDDVKDDKPTTQHGIIKLTGDMMLTLCIADDPSARPTTFTAGPANGLTLIEAVRAQDTTGRLAPAATSAPQPVARGEDFAAALQGRWGVIRVRNMEWHKDDPWVWQFSGRTFHHEMQSHEYAPGDGVFTLRPSSTPGVWELELAHAGRESAPPYKWIGIGKIEDGRLYFSFAPTGVTTRPKVFEYVPGSSWTVVLERR